MKKPFVWGTQVELQAAADYYDVYLSPHQERAAREVSLAPIHTKEEFCGYCCLQVGCHSSRAIFYSVVNVVNYTYVVNCNFRHLEALPLNRTN